MNILVIGGTRFMGVHLVTGLLAKGHTVTIATRGVTGDNYGDKVKRIFFDRTNADSIKESLSGLDFDVVFDSLAYCSNDIRNLLDTVKCKCYIEISSASVYESLHNDIREDEFDSGKRALVYCAREDFNYSIIKQQAECAITQDYPHIPSAMVRFPFVIGEDDYTNRLYFYVEHIIKQVPICIDNFENKMAFISSKEAGAFLAFLAESDYCGAVNGANKGAISLKEISEYIKLKTGKEILLSDSGDAAPYNGAEEYSINTERAEKLGFSFTQLDSWIYELLDHYILRCNANDTQY